jgi:hypothetical protein
MNTRSSIYVFSSISKTLGKSLAVTLILGATLTLSAPIVADASVSKKAAVSEGNGFIQQTKEQKQALSEKWGVELVAMRSTAAGHMVDFRYRVLDAKKAAPLFKRQTKPYLIHQASGKVLAVPNTAKLGSLRNSNTPQEGRTYWMFFGNHHRIVQKGDKVTVAIGDFRAADIEVD